MEGPRTLITGATGFIGSHLLPKLMEEGYDAYSLERYVTSRYVLGQRREFKTVFGDIREYFEVKRIIREVQPDIVVHLASVSPVSYSYDHPQEVIETNFLGTVNLAEACLREISHLRHFLFASSSEIYGNGSNPKTEETPPNPNSPYACSKLAAEKYLLYMRDAYDFPVTILRNFNCYDTDTQILTDHGWKYFYELGRSDQVATFNPETHMLEFQKPTEYFAIPHDGKVIHVLGNQLNLLVTPNHRMWVRRRWRREYEIMEASEMLQRKGKQALYFELSADWAEDPEPMLDAKWYDPNWIKFLAWWLSEGSIDRRPGHYEIQIRQYNHKNLHEIYECIIALGYKPHMNPNDGRIRFSDKELHDYLKQFGHAKDKFVPDEIKRLPKQLIRLFLNTYQKGDGSRGSYNGYETRDCIISGSSRMLDDLQELVLKAGWASSKNGRFLTIARTRTEVCPKTPNNFSVESYKGMVYCVSVPNEILYVRRHGKAVFCGNTYGRKNNTHFVVERSIAQMLQEETIRLGDPTPIRDFQYIEDHVNSYLACLDNPKAKGEIFNFSTGRGVSIRDLVHILSKLIDFHSEIIWSTIPSRPLDIKELIGDYSKAKRILGWKPKFTLEEGLRLTVEFWRKKLLGKTAL